MAVKVSVVLGELIGRYTNDYIMNVSIKRNNGVFEAESRLWYGILFIRIFILCISQHCDLTGHAISQFHSTSVALLHSVQPSRSILASELW